MSDILPGPTTPHRGGFIPPAGKWPTTTPHTKMPVSDYDRLPSGKSPTKVSSEDLIVDRFPTKMKWTFPTSPPALSLHSRGVSDVIVAGVVTS